MKKRLKYNKELKIKACEDYKNGNNSFLGIAKSIGCSKTTVMEWFASYSHHGANAFNESQRNRSYSKEFKMNVIKAYLSGEYSSMELSGKYNIALSMVKRWINEYNNGIEIKDYYPKGEVYTMKSRKTTFEERLKIVKWVVSNDMNYKEAASKFTINYANVYKWTKAFQKDGVEALKYQKRGPKKKNSIDESSLSEVERLKRELERERVLRKQREFELEVLKKKEEFEQKLHYRK